MSDEKLRNITFYHGNTGKLLGGLYQSGSITNANFMKMLRILLITEGEISVTFRSTGQSVSSDSSTLVIEDYDVFSTKDDIELNPENPSLRDFSRTPRGSHGVQFRDAVRTRDGKCVFTGAVNTRASVDRWEGFEAAHIFPIDRRLWEKCGFSRHITTTGPHHPIHSVQNGLLMAAHIHRRFDSYTVSVDPDDGYKIVDFGGDPFGVDGAILDFVCRDPSTPERVADELLRWHFRQAILANVKGPGSLPLIRI